MSGRRRLRRRNESEYGLENAADVSYQYLQNMYEKTRDKGTEKDVEKLNDRIGNILDFYKMKIFKFIRVPLMYLEHYKRKKNKKNRKLRIRKE